VRERWRQTDRHIKREMETHRHTERHKERERDGDRHRERQRERESQGERGRNAGGDGEIERDTEIYVNTQKNVNVFREICKYM
jgi:hypothetical protein